MRTVPPTPSFSEGATVLEGYGISGSLGLVTEGQVLRFVVQSRFWQASSLTLLLLFVMSYSCCPVFPVMMDCALKP